MAFGRNKEKKGKKEKIKLSKNSYKQAKNFLSFVKPYSGVYFIGFVFLLLSSGVSISLPILLGQILGADASQMTGEWEIGNMDNIYGVLTILAIILPAQAIFSFFRVITFHYVTHNSIKDMRQKAFEVLIKSPLSFFDSSKTGETISRISNDTEQIQETLTTTVAEFFRQLLIVLVGVIFIFRVSPKLVLIMLGVLPVAAITAIIFGRFIKKISGLAQDETAKSNHILEEALVGIKSLKAYTNEFIELKKYSLAVSNVKQFNMKAAMWRAVFIAFILTIMLGAIVFIIWQGIELIKTGEIPRQGFFQFILFTVMIGTSMGSLPDLFAKIQKSIGATESLMTIIQQETEDIDTSKPVCNHKTLRGEIELNNLDFAYPSRKEVQILNKLSLKITAGEQIALVGASGSGKSTIASLLLQFYKLDGGNIKFDGKEASEYAVNDLRSQMAFVPQEVILLGGSIEENIRYGKPNASDTEVQDAAKKANAFDFIDSFPNGFKTVVGDRGIQLSGGQRQRIAIARAILRDPAILILDEATSALDSESEVAVQDALNKLMTGRTSVVIAHRLSTIKNANSIVVMDNGAIAEQGTHDELAVKQNGIYKKLSEIQFS
ncbi:MAG: ABC-type multidrug transport system fused ATPase/permease subunit [Flavobacteriales bacterium]|jgi:ABC-type multidrug transport system fused ATPase/permease subunit|tara:strand:- start:17530 stop:19347 length:1818 start_codon:yes stop_codon:yes gene_type:complete